MAPDPLVGTQRETKQQLFRMQVTKIYNLNMTFLLFYRFYNAWSCTFANMAMKLSGHTFGKTNSSAVTSSMQATLVFVNTGKLHVT